MKLNIKEILQKGVSAHKEGKVQDAENFYRAILQTDPLHPDANHNLGVLELSLGKVDEAIKFFKIAIKVKPEIEQFWISYINTLIKEKRLKDAKEAIEQSKKHGFSLKIDISEINQTSSTPSDEEINNVLELYQKKEYEDTERQALYLTERFPKHPFAWRVLGALLKETGRLDESLVAIQKSTELSPEDAIAHYNLGITYRELGHLEEAVVSYIRSVSLNPDYAEAHYNLGNGLLELGRLDEAVKSYNQAIMIKSDYAEAHNNLGNTLKELGRIDEAVTSYNQAIMIKSDYAEAHNNLGNTLKELDRLDEAVTSYNQAIMIKSDYAEAHNNLGILLKDLGRLEEAEKNLRKAISLQPDNFSNAYDHLGSILQEKKSFDEAEDCYKKCISLEPNKTTFITMSRGSILFREGLFEQALNLFDTYDNATARACALESLYALGRIDEIYKRIKQNINLDGENLRVAAISAFLTEQQKKNTDHNFCNNPIDFIHYGNISYHLEDSNSFISSLIDELRTVKTKWELNTTQNGFQAVIDIFKNPSKKIDLLKSVIIDELDIYYSKFKNESCNYIKQWPSEKKIAGWHVILKKQGHQTSHIHPSGWLSGVIYLKVIPSNENNEGAIEFRMDGPQYPNHDSSKKIYQPKVGDMIFFPSSLHHRTFPFTTDVDRICISFDLIPI